MTRPSEVIERVLELWETSDKWCQGTDAQRLMGKTKIVPSKDFVDKVMHMAPDLVASVQAMIYEVEQKKVPCSPTDPSAFAWCAQGAVNKAMYDLCGKAPLYSYLAGEKAAEHRTLFIRVMELVSDQVPDDWWRMHIERTEAEHSCTDVPSCPTCSSIKAAKEGAHKSIVAYNDSKDTTFEDVRLCFKRALAELTE